MNTKVENHSTHFLRLKKAVQKYQLDRIKNTYKDFSISPQFKELTIFFFEQIYGPQDFGFRNDSIKTLYKKSHPFLRQDIVKAIEYVLELNDLSDTMDDMLVNQILKIGSQNELDKELYELAYIKCNNYDQRNYQIDLMVEATNRIFNLSHLWLIGASLTALHSFTDLLGMGKIMNFLYDGYQAFHNVEDITPFVEAVYQRETNINNRIFGKPSI